MLYIWAPVSDHGQYTPAILAWRFICAPPIRSGSNISEVQIWSPILYEDTVHSLWSTREVSVYACIKSSLLSSTYVTPQPCSYQKQFRSDSRTIDWSWRGECPDDWHDLTGNLLPRDKTQNMGKLRCLTWALIRLWTFFFLLSASSPYD